MRNSQSMLEPNSPFFRRSPLQLVRVVSGLEMVAHGCIRIYEDHVGDFGVFLEHHELPLPFALAWSISVFEVVGGACLALGLGVRPIATAFMLEIVAGIALVHAANGWFVVGPGKGGMEFSVLLATTFLSLACTPTNK